MKGLIIAVVFVVLSGLIFLAMYVSANDREVTLREQTLAQQEVCKANFDKMFKVIKQVAQVSDENLKQSKEAFKEIYPDLMKGRYSNDRGGALMSWVHESNPNFDMQATSDLYKQLGRVIEANRQEFFNEQRKLTDLKRAHSTHIKTYFNRNVFGLYNRGEIDITIITSETTEAAYSSGQENDIDLFD